ncbi:MAG: alkaline phosphatase family protein [Candidatus Eisenbacteria bacterium]
MKRLALKLSLVVVVALAVVWYVNSTRDHGSSQGPVDPPRTRVLLIGVDGMDWERAWRLASEGRMPNLGRMMENGASGVLTSIPPYVSPTVWTSIATGKLGAKHGIGGFTAYGQRGGTFELIGTGMIKCRTLWEILAAAERTSGVIGWLVTYPPVPVTTYTVSSRAVTAMSTEPGVIRAVDDGVDMSAGVHPPELWQSIVELGTYPSDISPDDVRRHLGSLEYLEEEEVKTRSLDIASRLAGDRTTVTLARRLMSDRPTDLTAVYLRGTDIVSHFFWRYWEPESWTRKKIKPEVIETLGPVIDRYYESVDGMIGEILEQRDDDTIVVVCSDHGFAGHRGHEGFVREGSNDTAFGVLMHRDKGIVVMEGPGIARGVRIEGATVLDITPTVLAALGLPAARDMDGRPLTAAFEQAFVDENPIAYIDTYETGEKATSDGPEESPVDDEIKELLKSLGYIN